MTLKRSQGRLRNSITCCRLATAFADATHESLRHYTVERGDEIVGLDPHVQQTSDDIDDVVGVDGGENEVACERRLHGDVRRLRVADLAHHDLVGVVPQDRPKAGGD